jgi:RNA polymerase sigma-70 factor (ECF subfamily)
MDHSSHSDDELLLIFQSGDIQGFNALYNRHCAALFHLASKILEDDELAKDTLQEIFVSFFQNAKEKQINYVKGYLLQSVKYRCFMHLRSGKISEKHLDRLQTVSSANYVEEYMDAQELQTLLRANIEALPEKCREVFYLSRYELLSNKKIAEQLNISQKTVEHQITKALKTLRVSLDKLALLALFLIS